MTLPNSNTRIEQYLSDIAESVKEIAGGGGGGSVTVETINGTLAAPFGDMTQSEWEQLAEDIINTNASVYLMVQDAALGPFKWPAVVLPGAAFKMVVATAVLYSGTGGSIGLTEPAFTISYSDVNTLEDHYAYDSNDAEVVELTPTLSTVLTIIRHPIEG